MMIEYYYSHEIPTSSGTKAKNRNVSRASQLQAVPRRSLLPGSVGRPLQLSSSGPQPDVYSGNRTGILPKAPLSPWKPCRLLSKKKLMALCAACHRGERTNYTHTHRVHHTMWQLMGCSHRRSEDLHAPPCSTHCWEDAQLCRVHQRMGSLNGPLLKLTKSPSY